MLGLLRRRLSYVGLRCTLHLCNTWYVARHEIAHFRSVQRCVKCGEPKSKRMLQLVARERSLWRAVPKDLTSDEQESWILERLYSDVHDAMQA